MERGACSCGGGEGGGHWDETLEQTKKDGLLCTNGFQQRHMNLRPMMDFPGVSQQRCASCQIFICAQTQTDRMFLHCAVHIFQTCSPCSKICPGASPMPAPRAQTQSSQWLLSIQQYSCTIIYSTNLSAVGHLGCLLMRSFVLYFLLIQILLQRVSLHKCISLSFSESSTSRRSRIAGSKDRCILNCDRCCSSVLYKDCFHKPPPTVQEGDTFNR